MNLNRNRLLADLNVLAPAIADRSKIPGLECIRFDGTKASTYNDLIGIEFPLETNFVGEVPGKLLIGYLDKIDTEEVTFETKSKDLHVSAGKSRLKVGLQPLQDKLWTLPEFDELNKIVLTKDFMTTLELCMLSFGKNTGRPEQAGITFEASKDFLNMYGTDAISLSCGLVPKQPNYSCDRVTVVGEFCEQLLKLCRADDTLWLSPTGAMATNKAGTLLFGKIEQVEEPLDFDRIIDYQLPSKMDEFISIPQELDQVIGRAEMLAYGANDTVQLTLTNNNLRLYLKSEFKHELDESIDLESEITAKAHFDPKLVKRALSERTFLYMSTNGMVLTGPDNFTHIISSRVVND